MKFELMHVCSHDLLAMSNKAVPPPIPMSRKVDSLGWKTRNITMLTRNIIIVVLTALASIIVGDGITNEVVDVFIEEMRLEGINMLLEPASDTVDSDTSITDDEDDIADAEYDGVGDRWGVLVVINTYVELCEILSSELCVISNSLSVEVTTSPPLPSVTAAQMK